MQASGWIALGIALLVLMYVLAPVLAPFAFAAIIAYLLAPGVDWLMRHRVPRAVAVLLMILLTGLVLLGLLLILVPVLQREIIALQAQFPTLVSYLNTTVAPKLQEWFGIQIQFDSQTLRELVTEKVASEDIVARIIQHARAGGVALLGVLGTLLLVPVVLFYALLDWHDIKARIEVLIPRRWHAMTTGMLAEIDALLAQFLRGQLSVMLALALYYSVALAIAGFQTALPIGILTGLLVFIPYVGFTLGLLLAILAALLQFSSWYGLIAVGIIYGVGQLIETFFLTPRLVGERIGLHPLAVIFALLAFGQVFGFLGVLLALPASAALLVALRRLKGAYLASDFYRDPEEVRREQSTLRGESGS
ncbi:MAG TPA: AI-2E family transporter [Burkholderiaceae bacterium]|nr:AI-2E family transporter [Burkholderiaceae bacterium]